ncbi:MAG TPA: hypothetical protein VK426_06975 [Methanobacterium sp.]|nr:hypothetical protein [Methanobacterium sp.]
MSVNQNEANLEAITITIAHLEKNGKCDEKLIKELKDERDRLLRELNVHSL